MSRMDFTPAETTVTGVLDSTVRSADSSKVSLAPRCTPPRPPVAKTAIPTRAASTEVAATVVPPVTFLAIATAISRLLTLTTDSSEAMRSSSSGTRPTLGTPSMSAIVAAVTPWPARIASNSRAAARLPGRGRPCEMIVDSSATTGAPARSAAPTGGDTSSRDDTGTIVSPKGRQPVGTGRHQLDQPQPRQLGQQRHPGARHPERQHDHLDLIGRIGQLLSPGPHVGGHPVGQAAHQRSRIRPGKPHPDMPGRHEARLPGRPWPALC